MSDLGELNTQQSIGRLEGTVSGLQTQVSGMDAKLTEVVAYINQQKGALTVTRWVSSIVGGIFGAGAAAAFEYLRTKHGG